MAHGSGLRTAVLLSAGLDSAVLAASEARTSHVHPIYVSTGLAWEEEERAALGRLLASAPFREMEAPAQLTFTVRDLYAPTHWALRGQPPAFDTPDEDVYLTGRNVILLTKAGIHCAQHRITRLALGPLAGNPFPDATPEFFAAMARALSLGLAHDLDVATPLSAMHKHDVIRLGVSLGVPLELTLSCMSPRDGAHCGQCSKCRERRDAFHEAGVSDPTAYATVPVR
ncbi:MAG TPA: 7-cyano-7-deazaguanine synthase [Vicinamibacterales bacterium]|jgi:7-cyano-7-deazaguanine synthase|nr:7-cyano-7-deazaguanine synthase [Vicinamibacterales bacterium]